MLDEKLIKKINRCIVKIANGNIAALEKLFEITQKPLLIVAKSYLNDKNSAEDVLSDAYLKVVKSAYSFDKNQNGYNWLYEIVKNTALNQNIRDTIRQRDTVDEFILPDYDCIDEILEKMSIDVAVQTLTLTEKQLLYEYYFEGKTIREIAQIHNKPPTTTFDLLHRTIDKLKKYFL